MSYNEWGCEPWHCDAKRRRVSPAFSPIETSREKLLGGGRRTLPFSIIAVKFNVAFPFVGFVTLILN